jgi:hypothetical protein
MTRPRRSVHKETTTPTASLAYQPKCPSLKESGSTRDGACAAWVSCKNGGGSREHEFE